MRKPIDCHRIADLCWVAIVVTFTLLTVTGAASAASWVVFAVVRSIVVMWKDVQ